MQNLTVETLVERIEALETMLSNKIHDLEKLLNERERVNRERFRTAQERVDAAMSSAEKAISKAEMATERRFEGVNEFRQALADQSSTLVTKAEFNIQRDNVAERFSTLSDRVLNIEAVSKGKAMGVGNIAAIVLGILTLISTSAAVIALLIRH